MLQHTVLGEQPLRLGVRKSPVFVGQNGFCTQIGGNRLASHAACGTSRRTK